MSSVEVHPSQGLNDTLVLGTSLYHTVSSLKLRHQRLEFAYCAANYLDTPILVTLPDLGVRLMFEPTGGQPLVLIEVLNFNHMKLTYKGMYLNDIVTHVPSDEELIDVARLERLAVRTQTRPPTLKEIYNRIFGPTFPGVYCAAKKTYMLSYPGVAFKFEVQLPELAAKIAAQSDKNALLLKLTNWPRAAEIPCVSLALFRGDDYQSFTQGLSSRVQARPHAPLSDLLDLAIAKVVVVPKSGAAEVHFAPHSKRQPISFRIGESTQQHVLRVLGPPDASFNKFDSRLLIHKHLQLTADASSVYKFHNYFRYGIDLLYNLNPPSGHGGVLEKIILHNGGILESLDFLRWNKCNWRILNSNDGGSVSSDMYFREFGEKWINPKDAEPVLLNRNDYDGANELDIVSVEDYQNESEPKDAKSPNMKTWGQLRLYQGERCIWEVNESSDCVSCVTVY